MSLLFIDHIWCVRGSLVIDPPQSPREAFDKLDGLFHETGTTYDLNSDTLTFSKKAPVAQDRMATFNSGRLRVIEGLNGPELLYELSSQALLFCFTLPFLFLLIAWLIKESRTPGYVFAGIFAVLYVIGRILEPRLIRSVFRKSLSGASSFERRAPVA